MNVRYYERVCAECGDISTVTYKPKTGTLCPLCRGKRQAKDMQGKNKKPAGTHKRYWYFCPNCPSVRSSPAKHKSNLCGPCSRRATGKANKSKIKNPPATQKVVKPKKPKPKKTYKPVGYDGKQKVQLKKPEVIHVITKDPEILPFLDEEISRRMQEEFLAKRRNNEV